MSDSARIDSWGRTTHARQEPVRLSWRDVNFESLPTNVSLLPHGLGRSYGDACLNDGGALLMTRGLDRFISFDEKTGVLRCESGVSLDEIIRAFLPRGWFLPVTPGTKFVTVGGAVANDVHGGNHHRAGTFGRFVRSFELVRSDGRYVCSATENPELFRATIGGLGLTGLMTWVEFELRRVAGPLLEVETVKYGELDEFFALTDESDATHEYTKTWVDCLATGKSLGRGHFMRGNHSAEPEGRLPRKSLVTMPFDAPKWLVNPLTVRLFNSFYFHRQLSRVKRMRATFDPFFYPLDVLADWNRGYGSPGFFEYQCVVPPASMRDATRALLVEMAKSRAASIVSVLKTFGDVPSPGMMSFPSPGATLAVDFANRGDVTRRLFDRLDAIVREAGGAVYPAKDAHMSPDDFRRYFPRLDEFAKYVDPRFSSSFWRRVTDRKGILR